MAFVHLHTHSEYSLLDGANRIPDLLDRVQSLGMDSLAITDHGNLHGAWQFYTEAKARNVRPILGFEAYLAFGSRLKRERPTDAPGVYSHLVLLARGPGKDLGAPTRFRFFGQESYVKSGPEMAALFADHPEVLAETARVAEGCEFDFEKRYFLPQYPRPPEFASDNDLLVHLARAGAAVRYGDPLPRAVQERLDYELGVISHTGYAGYFLIVYDIVKAAKDRGIPVGPGRGSAAGSLVAYALRITDTDPLQFGLPFAPFRNPE